MESQRIDTAVITTEIRSLYDAYADIVSRKQWELLSNVFDENALLDLHLGDVVTTLCGTADIAAKIGGALDRFEFFQFVVMGITIEQRSDDHVVARAYICELRQDVHTHAWSQIYGVYHDSIELRTDGWKFSHRRYHSLARRGEDAATAQIIAFPKNHSLSQLF